MPTTAPRTYRVRHKHQWVQVDIYQERLPKQNSSIFYDGTVMTFTHKDRQVSVFAEGDTEIRDKAGLLVFARGNKHRDEIEILNDRTVNSLSKKGYVWDHNNWFAFEFKTTTQDSWTLDSFNVVHTYDEAFDNALWILFDESYWVTPRRR